MCKVYQISIRNNMEGATRTFLISSEQVKSRFSAIKYTLNKLELNNAIVTDVMDDTAEKMVAVINDGQYEAVVMKMMDGFVEITPEPKPARELHSVEPNNTHPIQDVTVHQSIVPMDAPPTYESANTMSIEEGINRTLRTLELSPGDPFYPVVLDIVSHVASYPETLNPGRWLGVPYSPVITFIDSIDSETGKLTFIMEKGMLKLTVTANNRTVYSAYIRQIDDTSMFRIEDEKTADGMTLTHEVIQFLMKLQGCIHNPNISTATESKG